MEKKNNKGVVILVSILIILVLGLGCYIIYDKVITNMTGNNESNNVNINDSQNGNTSYSVKNNVTILTDININNECVNGCSEIINTKDGKQITVIASEKKLNIGDNEIVSFGNDSIFLYQTTILDDIVITLQNSQIVIYNLDGKKIKIIGLFTDREGRLFHTYSRYSDDIDILVSDDGKISFVGTKHFQGVANTYMNDYGDTIDICKDGYNISDDEIVSGIFEFSYLGNENFTDIKYVKTKITFADLKNCQ